VPAAPKRVPSFDELYREIQRLPSHLTGQILIPGVLTMMSRPGAAHHDVLALCNRSLERFDELLGGHG
jgi:hypothetical protein